MAGGLELGSCSWGAGALGLRGCGYGAGAGARGLGLGDCLIATVCISKTHIKIKRAHLTDKLSNLITRQY